MARGPAPAPVADAAGAAAVTGAAYGAALPGPPSLRGRSTILGAGLGAAVAIPAALAQQALLGLLPEGERARAAPSAAAAAAPPPPPPSSSSSRGAAAVASMAAKLEADVAASRAARGG